MQKFILTSEVNRGNGSSVGGANGTAAIPNAAFTAFGCAVNGAAITHYLGYNINGGLTLPGTVTVGDAGYPMRIGRRQDNGVFGNHDIAEILIYDHAVSDAERLQIVNYLNNKWGITVVQLADVPPTVTLLTPTNGMSVSAPSTISVIAQIINSSSPIGRVDFMVNGLLAASRTAPPYQIPLQVLSPGTLTIQAHAVDFWGASSNSAPVVVTVTGSGPASPPATGCDHWRRGNAGVTTNVDGTVATWADQSGNGNNAAQDLAQGYPSPMLTNDLGGRPVLNFDGTDRKSTRLN